jgi:predicted GNAT superfamily acetyltransferase
MTSFSRRPAAPATIASSARSTAIPPNPASDAFHAALGFAEVGSARLFDGMKTVRYLARPLTG